MESVVVMGTKIPVFIPFRSDHGKRAENWLYIEAFVWDRIDWTEIVMGESPDGPFNISAARNDAAAKIDWDVAIFADADSFVRTHELETAVAEAQLTRQVILPHSRWVNVDQDEMVQFMMKEYLPYNPERTIVPGTKSSVLVIPREAYDAVNGYDERFRGWGWEDTAFHLAVERLYKPFIQFEGNVWHLEHERPDADINRGFDENAIRNRQHFQNYKRARTDTELRKLISGNRASI